MWWRQGWDRLAKTPAKLGRGRCLGRQRCGGLVGYDHRYAAADEIGCKRRQPIILIFRPAVFNRNILAFVPAKTIHFLCPHIRLGGSCASQICTASPLNLLQCGRQVLTLTVMLQPAIRSPRRRRLAASSGPLEASFLLQTSS